MVSPRQQSSVLQAGLLRGRDGREALPPTSKGLSKFSPLKKKKKKTLVFLLTGSPTAKENKIVSNFRQIKSAGLREVN